MANPNPTPFPDKYKYKKGEIHNPGGRPKGFSIVAELRKLMDEPDLLGKEKNKTNKRLVAETLVRMARKENPHAHKLLLERTDGACNELGEGDRKTLAEAVSEALTASRKEEILTPVSLLDASGDSSRLAS